MHEVHIPIYKHLTYRTSSIVIHQVDLSVKLDLKTAIKSNP